MNSVATSGPAARVIGVERAVPGHAAPTGAPSRRMAWLCVAAMPMPSHSAMSCEPGAAVPRPVADVEDEDRRDRLTLRDRGRDHAVGDAGAAAEVLVAA